MASNLKVIRVDNFGGGRNSMSDPTMLDNSMCVSASKNVWTPYGSLTKTPGCTIYLAITASAANVSWASIFADDNVNSSFNLYHRFNYPTGAASTGTFFPWAGQTDSLTPLGYTTGTVSVSGANRVSATGSGTSWSTHVSAGDMISFSTTSSAYYRVSSVEDDTHLTLTSAVTVAVATGSSYKALPPVSFLESPVASLNGFISWCSTADVMQQYDGTGMLRRASAPSAAYLAVHRGYQFAARTSTAQSRLYWSAINDPTSWPVNNFIDIDRVKGVITGIFSFGSELIVFKNKGMYRVIGDVFDPANPTFSVIPVAVPAYFTFTANASVSIVTQSGPWSGRMLFWSSDNIFMYLQGTNYVTNLSNLIRRDFAVTTNSTTDSMANPYQRVRSFSIKDYWVLRGFGSPDVVKSAAFIADLKGAWWYVLDDNQSAGGSPFASNGPVAITQVSNNSTVIFSASDTAAAVGRIYSCNITGPTYATSTIDPVTGLPIAINGVWASKEFNIEYGTFKWIVVYLQKQSAGNLTVAWSVDQATAVSNTIDMTTGRGRVIRAVLPVNQKGSTIQITLSNNTVSQTFNIYAFNIIYEPSELERLL